MLINIKNFCVYTVPNICVFVVWKFALFSEISTIKWNYNKNNYNNKLKTFIINTYAFAYLFCVFIIHFGVLNIFLFYLAAFLFVSVFDSLKWEFLALKFYRHTFSHNLRVIPLRDRYFSLKKLQTQYSEKKQLFVSFYMFLDKNFSRRELQNIGTGTRTGQYLLNEDYNTRSSEGFFCASNSVGTTYAKNRST